MGCGIGSMMGSYTEEQFQSEVAQFSVTLGRLSNGLHGPNVLVLQGSGWIFNDKPPLDTALLRGLITPGKYQEMIASLNNAHAKAMVGQPRMFAPTDIPGRRKIGQDAVTARLDELNAELATTGLRFDLDAGQVNVQVTGVQGGGHNSSIHATTIHTQETFLFLILPTVAASEAGEGPPPAYKNGASAGFCAKCGTANPGGDNPFCAKCGQKY